MNVQATAEIPLSVRRWKAYRSYKDSGIKWLGVIPEHWEVKRIKFLASFYGGGTPSKENLDYWNGDIPWVSPKDMKTEIVHDSEEHITEEGLAGSATQLVQAGAVLVVVRSGILKHSIPVAVNMRPVALNQDMKAMVPRSVLSPHYLKYLIVGHQDALLVEWRKAGATVESIEHELLVNSYFPIPSLGEQRSIIDLLDRETAKIDALVAKKERLIELLQEKRAALITRAVTKGLPSTDSGQATPNVPMKDSGVEWLGKVPAHWEVRPLHHVLTRITYGFTNPMPVNDEGPFLLTANDIGDGEILYSAARRTTMDAYSKELTDKCRPKSGDILVTKDGTLGRVAVADGTPVCINQSVALLRADDFLVVIDFLQNVLRADSYQNRMIFEAGGTAIKHIYISRLAKMPVAFPPRAEQEAIAKFVNERRHRLNTLIAKIREGIEKLKEYRTALISAAVTGKIDVREEISPQSDGRLPEGRFPCTN